MKKNYIYLILLVIVTVLLTLLFSYIYKSKVDDYSYSYKNMNRITSLEFDEYMMEHPDTIIYISDKNNVSYQKFEKKLIKKLEQLNLLERVIYIDKSEINNDLEEKWARDYSFKYEDEKLPTIVVINDNVAIQTVIVDDNSDVNTIIEYGVFE